MSNERGIDVTETVPPAQDEWDEFGEPLDPGPAPEPTPQDADLARPAKNRVWRFVPRSLSSRLVVFVVALVVVVISVTGACTYVALKSFLYNRLDQQVISLANANEGSIQTCIVAGGMSQCRLGGGISSSNLHAPQRQWLIVLDSSGNRIGEPVGNDEIKVLDLTASQARAAVTDRGTTHTWKTQDGTTLRVAARAARLPGGGFVVVVSGLGTDEVTRTLGRLVLIEIAIGTVAVAIALILTSWGVHLSLRPLSRVTRTARDVTAELSPDGAGLDRRVPVTDPQTEVGQLGESFNTLMGTVETQFAARVESEERMRQFLADASHELRTPLTSIRGYAELSRLRRANGDTEHADTMDRIESEGTRMSRLVEDLLLLARSDQGAPPELEAVDVGELIEDAVEGARAAYPQRRIDAEAPVALTVQADRDQLLRVLRNLITNAAVHTSDRGLIRVSGQFEGDELVLRVADAGPGLPADEAPHVFERFWRADKARTRARGGSGLGLAIVASIVQAHRGTVRFDSTVERGSTVTVRLPARS
jgi:two-component system OmpR family sensor kinase